jgi:2-iminobutanoate/2-iminopropanoate deaminase
MSKRQSVDFAAFRHLNPIPNACRVGNIVMSSVINGMDPGTRNMPPALEQQLQNMFNHIRSAVEAAGGTVEDIIKINVWMKEPVKQREALNTEWVKMFPDKDSRPARHTMALGPESNALVTCDFTAVLG